MQGKHLHTITLTTTIFFPREQGLSESQDGQGRGLWREGKAWKQKGMGWRSVKSICGSRTGKRNSEREGESGSPGKRGNEKTEGSLGAARLRLPRSLGSLGVAGPPAQARRKAPEASLGDASPQPHATPRRGRERGTWGGGWGPGLPAPLPRLPGPLLPRSCWRAEPGRSIVEWRGEARRLRGPAAAAPGGPAAGMRRAPGVDGQRSGSGGMCASPDRSRS